MRHARSAFAKAHANRISEEEIACWTDQEFLNRARVTKNGQLTRAALLLLGKPEAVDKLPAGMFEMTWSWWDRRTLMNILVCHFC